MVGGGVSEGREGSEVLSIVASSVSVSSTFLVGRRCFAFSLVSSGGEHDECEALSTCVGKDIE